MIANALARLRWFWEAWCDLFFSPVSFLTVGVFRALIAACGIVLYTVRFFDWRYFFGDLSPVTPEWAKDVFGDFYQPPFFWFPSTDAATVGLQIALLAALVALLLGVGGRLTAFAVAVLHLAFIQRNFTVMYGADRVITFAFFFLILMENDRAFSLASWLGWKTGAPKSALSSSLTSVGLRLAQFQLCIIYGYTGLEKMKGSIWWEGTTIWTLVGNRQLLTIDVHWLLQFPLIVGAMTFSVVLFEIYFPVLVWLPKTRPWVLAFGVLFHSLIGLLLALPLFSAVMVACYVLFIGPETVKRALKRLRVPAKLRSEPLALS